MTPRKDPSRIGKRIATTEISDADSVQAETYYNRAALLIHSTQDRELQLAFKLCQARIMDYSRKFLEAALRYHELSWEAEIDEDERKHMLYVPLRYYCSIVNNRLSHPVLPQ